MRNRLIQQFACVSDGTVKKYEMLIFRGRMAIENFFIILKRKPYGLAIERLLTTREIKAWATKKTAI